MLLLCSETLLPPQYLLTQLQTHTESLFQKGLSWCVQNQCLLFLVLFSIETRDLLFPKHGQCIFPPFAHAGPSIRMLHILPALAYAGHLLPDPFFHLSLLSLCSCTHISAMSLLVPVACITCKVGEKDRGLFLFTFVFPMSGHDALLFREGASKIGMYPLQIPSRKPFLPTDLKFFWTHTLIVAIKTDELQVLVAT